jgi:hypothetical protein
MLHAEVANLLSRVLVSEGLSPAIYSQTYCAGTNPGFMGPKTYTILGTFFKKGYEYHEYKNYQLQITSLENLTNTTNITKFRKIR